MGRIPSEEIDRIKREVLARVRAVGVELKRHGANWLGRCPFHADRTPCQLSPEIPYLPII